MAVDAAGPRIIEAIGELTHRPEEVPREEIAANVGTSYRGA